MIFQVITYWSDFSLAEILEKISLYYGFYYEYDYKLENSRVLMKLNIIDPLNANNNVGGKNT